MACKDLCVKYKAKKNGTLTRYGNGQKRCQVCEIFLSWNGLRCPCCGYRLRTKPRRMEFKAKIGIAK